LNAAKSSEKGESKAMPFKYSVVLAALAPGGANVWRSPHEVLEVVAELGYDGVDLDTDTDKIDPRKFKEVTDIAESLGLKIPALVAAWGGWHAGEERDLASTDERVRSHAVSYAKKCIDQAASMGGPVVEIALAPLHPQYPLSSIPIDVLRRNFMRSAGEIAEYATARRVPMAIEAINRFEGYAGFLNSTVEAVRIVEEIGSDYLGVLVDLFHANIEDGPIAEVLRRTGSRLMYVHLADSNRQAPGTGHLDFNQILRALAAIGYQGYMSIDCCPPLPDWKTLLRDSIVYMKELERKQPG
jgi:sugar phosphate isomerase/epimerase